MEQRGQRKGRIKQIENDLYEKFCLRFQIKDPTDN